MISDIVKFLGGIHLNSPPPEQIYHYTSINSLESIINNEQLWVTHSHYMNDREEGSYFWRVVTVTLDALILNESRNPQQLKSFADIVFNKIEYDSMYKPYTDQYVLSFSCAKDSLSMWNYYGKNDGYCIGFNSSSLSEVIKENGIYPLSAKVEYNIETQVKIIGDSFMKVFLWYLQNAISLTEDSKQILVDQLFEYWAWYAPFFKHYSFHPEQEFRMVFYNDKLLDSTQTFETNYRVYQGIMAPYIKIDISDFLDNFPVNSITVGPMIKHELALEGLKGWLNKKETTKEMSYNIEFLLSEIPLRF